MLVAWVGAASADPAADKKHAGELAQEGKQHYKRGEFEVSVALLKQAYALYPEPTLLYNLARSLEGVGDEQGAVDAYKQYLASAADIEDRGAIERRVTTLEAELAEKTPVDQPTPVPTPPVVVETPAPKPLVIVDPPHGLAVAPIAVAAFGAVALGTGAYFGFAAKQQHDDAVNASTGFAAKSFNDTSHRDALIGNIAMIGGGAALAGGIIWAIVFAPQQRREGRGVARPHLSYEHGARMDVLLIRFALIALTACHYADAPIEGKACPCPDGYSCVANACVAGDIAPDARFDATSTASCIAAPKLTPVYASATFAEYPTGFATISGDWTTTGAALHQGDETAAMAVAYLATNPGSAGDQDYRVVATAAQTAGGDTGAFEVSGRISAINKTMYSCSYQPNTGLFQVSKIATSGGDAAALDSAQTTPGDQLGAYTIELQVTGGTVECCVRGIANSHLMAPDAAPLATGVPGVRTFLMAASFSELAVYQ